MSKVLIVDNLEINLQVLKVLFLGNNYEVVLAKNGADALEKAKLNPPDIIISDILMPVMDGYALCREWMKNDILKNIPFIFYTATYTDIRDEFLAYKLGATKFIIKPMDLQSFLKIVKQVLHEYCDNTLIKPKNAIGEEKVVQRLYNESLIRKLEKKMLDLEKANKLLEQDIVERKKAEEDRLKLQEMLNQSQKLEAIGRLAGGVAHDFNNMLAAIIGYAELAMFKITPEDQSYRYFTEILKTSQRSADLTRQLLAFARKQSITPQVIDLNHSISGILKLLHRLIGEEIALNWQPAQDLWKVKIDTTHVDQILVNLIINARDAISGNGNISIESSNITIDNSFNKDHQDIKPGEYVQLIISDNGCGMSPETISHIFEPFFTTKTSGKGTGLGLSTVYGIVKQNDGYICVNSELNKRTEFKIYLPRIIEIASISDKKETHSSFRMGTETILVVDDEIIILDFIREVLEKLGYNVLSAETPSKAIQIAKEYTDKIHLLITDLILPEMNGILLGDEIFQIKTGIKILYLSGYPDDLVCKHGIMLDDTNFLQKPFTVNCLMDKISACLDFDNPDQAVFNPA